MRCSTSSTRAASVGFGVAGEHRHRRLRDDRAGIHFRHDEMHGRAVLLRAGRERARVRVEALERRQQRRMDVEQPAVPARTNHGVSSRMKPARQTSSIRCACKLVLQRALERLAVLAERRVVDDGGRDAGGARRAASPGASGRWKRPARSRPDRPASFAASISATMLEPRPEIRMATRLRAMRVTLRCRGGRCRSRAARPSARRRARRAARRVSPSRLSTAATLSAARGVDHGDHADAAVERAQHFRLGDAAGLRQPVEHRQHRDAREVDARAEALRQHARDVVGEAAAGDVRQRLDAPGLADRGEAGFHIDARRRRARLRRASASLSNGAGALQFELRLARPPCAPANSRWSARRTRRGRA